MRIGDDMSVFGGGTEGKFDLALYGASPVSLMRESTIVSLVVGGFSFEGVLGEATRWKFGPRSGFATFLNERRDSLTVKWDSVGYTGKARIKGGHQSWNVKGTKK